MHKAIKVRAYVVRSFWRRPPKRRLRVLQDGKKVAVAFILTLLLVPVVA
jgi:hypothetical protein